MAQPVAAESLCSCGQVLDANNAHALACRRGAGKQIRHRILIEFVRRAFLAAVMPVLLELTDLSRKDGKRPDGVTVLPFRNGRALSWDATCVHPLAASYVDVASKAPKAVAALAETRKRSKYLPVLDRVDIVPLAVETTGAVGLSFLELLRELSIRIEGRGGGVSAYRLLLRELSAAVQLGNAICVLELHG